MSEDTTTRAREFAESVVEPIDKMIMALNGPERGALLRKWTGRDQLVFLRWVAWQSKQGKMHPSRAIHCLVEALLAGISGSEREALETKAAALGDSVAKLLTEKAGISW